MQMSDYNAALAFFPVGHTFEAEPIGQYFVNLYSEILYGDEARSQNSLNIEKANSVSWQQFRNQISRSSENVALV